MDDDDENKEKAKNLANQAKTAANDGRLLESMELFKQVYALYPSEKIKKRMEKLQEFINSQESDDDEDADEMVDIGKKFFLHKSIADNLYDYQKQGVLWFWKLYKRNSGGILGDDMGLGKTIQVIAFISGMFDLEKIKTVVIVAPLAVLVNWENEFKKWSPGIRIKSFHGPKKQRETNLRKIQQSKGVLLTTYGMVLSNAELLSGDRHDDNCSFRSWDYIILDEGHKIKNPNKTSKTIRSIPANFHYICTGTAIQNNLMEMWSLFDFTHEGELLGTRKTFDMEFQKPIVRAREKDANAYSQQVGNLISERLRAIIAPYFLRRTKADIFGNKEERTDVVENIVDSNGKKVVLAEEEKKNSGQCIPKLDCVKHDLIIWVYLNSLQLNLYQGLTKSERVKKTLLTKRSPLTELNCLKKICDHPRLQTTLAKFLTSAESQEARLDCGLGENDDVDDTAMPAIIDEAAHAPPVEELIKDSGKMVFLVSLMEELKKGHHRTLIFSQSRKMLDIIQKVLMSSEHKLLRIDGSISNPQDREKIIKKFQNDHSYNVLLMTTQIGSVGLNLVTADRLVIFDPSWNPGTDSQAVDRIYRLGQTKDVVIYRLITCGSIEEKIYRKQIFKNAIMKQTTGSSDNPYRYFTNQQLKELFVLDDPKSSVTHMQLEEMHTMKSTDEYFNGHLNFLNDKTSVFGVSHHDQLFTQEATDEKLVGFEEQIVQQVELATQRVTEEINNMEITELKKKNKSNSESLSTSGQNDGNADAEYLSDVSIEEVSAPTSRQTINNADISLQIVHEEYDNSFIDDEEDPLAKLNATLANIKLDDPPGGKKSDADDVAESIESISILDESAEENTSNIEEENNTSTHGPANNTKDNTKDTSGSSAGDLYVSCIVESDERRTEMAKVNSTFGVVNNADSPEQSKNDGECRSVQLASDSSDDEEETKSDEPVNDGSMCLVNDTDTDDDDTDTDDNFISDGVEIKSPVHNEIILDSFNNDGSHHQTPKTPNVATSLIHTLGKSYRTPPFSPVDLTRAESIRRGNRLRRDASTPMDSTHLSHIMDTSTQRVEGVQGLETLDESEKVEEISCNAIENHVKPTEGKSFVDVQDMGCSPKDLHETLDETEKVEEISCNAIENDVKPTEGKSFVDVHDMGCSPISVSSLKNEADDKYRDLIQDTIVDVMVSKSFIDVQDMGCSPINMNTFSDKSYRKKSESFSDNITHAVPVDESPCKKSVSFIDNIADTVPVDTSTCKKSDSFSDDIEDTVPVEQNAVNHQSFDKNLTDSIEDTVPVGSDNIVKKSKGDYKQYEEKPRKPAVVQHTESEESEPSEGMDFGRLEKMLEKSIHNTKSPSVLREVDNNKMNSISNVSDLKRLGPCDLELSRTLGHCMLQSKRNSPNVNKSPIVKKVSNSPLVHSDSPNVRLNSSGVRRDSPNLNSVKLSNNGTETTNGHINSSQTCEDSPHVHVASPGMNIESQNLCVDASKGTELKTTSLNELQSVRAQKLKLLTNLLTHNTNNPSVDDHILMEIADLIQELNIGGFKM